MARYERYSIAHALQIMGISQRAVAAQTGLSQPTISRASQVPWAELEYELASQILAVAQDERYPGRYEINRNADGTVESVFFITD